MPAFHYQALDGQGHTRRGVLQADTPRAARGALREQGMHPLSVDLMRGEQRHGLRRGLGGTQLALLTRQLATLVRAGLPMDEALAALTEQSEAAKLRGVVLALRARVMEGQTLAAALAEFPDSFPEIYRASVAAGEHSGRLDEVLERLADLAERRDSLRRRLIAALSYPLLLTVVALAVVAGLMAHVVPEVVGVFAGLGQELPWPTRVLLALGAGLRAYGLWLLLGLGALVVAFLVAMRRPALRARWQAVQLRLPLIGRLLRTAESARLTRALAVLSAAAVPLLEALRLAAQGVALVPMREALVRASQRVREGVPFARALAAGGVFPPIVLRLVASCERSGRLDEMLERAAEQQENELDAVLGVLTAVLGPLVILLVGALVLFIVLAVLLPIFELNTLIR
ncbi:MAG TPA: type II secretion system inner membrane protein GspF [Xanthomonadaceae bacterium]|nr:type II secretion system inner membrane protein GspF [Xanthomonadaceae bacterium]